MPEARLLLRAPNHLGDLVLALPALGQVEGDVVVRRGLAPLVRLALPGRRVIALDPGPAGMARAALALRRGGYRRGLLLPPSFSSALLFALGGVRERRGEATDGRRLLLTDPLPPAPRGGGGLHRAARYWELVTGLRPERPPVPSLPVPPPLAERWAALAGAGGGRPGIVGVCPGSRASARRWEPERFRRVVAALARQGFRVAVFGDRAERDLTRSVADGRALDLGGRLDLPLLAAALAGCRAVLANDSGPMHLAAAVGTPVVSLWGAGDPRETGPLGPGHLVLRHPELPCVPCGRNACPRRGRGTLRPEAARECLALIEPEAVLGALDRVLVATSATADRAGRDTFRVTDQPVKGAGDD
ncbi:MAG TPA: glycosyltransferase family 9 protein [Gemmatimonadales bacterium]|jgi:heptosyltransferase-2|nr:glycosyltransferase family 9 protein [Gemmatimonadales bacterium]